MEVLRLVGKPRVYLATHSKRNRQRLEESGIAEKVAETVLPTPINIANNFGYIVIILMDRMEKTGTADRGLENYLPKGSFLKIPLTFSSTFSGIALAPVSSPL